jgi:hypothetical protein
MRPPPDIRRIQTFRTWVPVFEVLDHESGSTIVAVAAAGSTVLAGLALVESRLVRSDVAGLTLVAFLALAALVAALVMAAGETVAWLLARPVGRDLARAAASLDLARVAIARIRPIVVVDDVDLAPYAARIERAAGDLQRWLTDADAAIVACGAMPDPATRVSRFELLRAEGRAIRTAAEAFDAQSQLLRWIAACPWSPLRPEALTRLSRDLAAAERLATDPD